MLVNPTAPIFYKFRTSRGWKIQVFQVPTKWLQHLEDANHNKITPRELKPHCLDDYYVVQEKMSRVPLMDLLNKLPCEKEWVIKNE